MSKIMYGERRLIEETLKAFQANEWCITPEAICGFVEMHGEHVELEKVVAVLLEQHEEGARRNKTSAFYCGNCGWLPIADYPHACPKQEGERKFSSTF